MSREQSFLHRLLICVTRSLTFLCYLGITWIIIILIVISLFVTGGEVILRFGLLTARKQPTLIDLFRAMKEPATGRVLGEL